MIFVYSILCGLLQAFTEFLPVSSSGHLAIVGNLLHMSEEAELIFEVFFHLGTAVAIFLVYFYDFKRLLAEAIMFLQDILRNIRIFFINLKKTENVAYKRLVHTTSRKYLIFLILSEVPVILIGWSSHRITVYFCSKVSAIGVGFLLNGIFLLIADRLPKGKKQTRDMTYSDALWIGILQSLAIFPGISRIGMALAGCLLCGMNRKFAVKYSLTLSVPASFGAFLLELIVGVNAGAVLVAAGIFGCVLAFFLCYIFLERIIRFLRKKSFSLFAYYSFLIGIFAIVSYFRM